MQIKRYILTSLCLFSSIFVPVLTSAFSGSEVHITKEGIATVTSAKVMQIAGNTFYTRLYWGDAYIRLLVKTSATTKFYRGTGEVTTLSEVAIGNLLDISGRLESGSESLVLVAETIKNSSVQKQQTVFSGKVTSIDLSARKFTLNTTKLGLITVNATSATQFTKGSRTLDLEHVKVGDTIIKVSGDYDFNTKTLMATSILIYVDLNIYKPQNFQGLVQEVTEVNLPASLKVMIGNISYKVNITAKTEVLNKNRAAVILSRFVVGDIVRLYGAIREIDDPVIDAEVVRNLNL